VHTYFAFLCYVSKCISGKQLVDIVCDLGVLLTYHLDSIALGLWTLSSITQHTSHTRFYNILFSLIAQCEDSASR